MAGKSRSLIAEIFSEQVAARADHPAALCEGRRLTYARLDQESDLIAARLAESGVGDGDIVGIALRRSELCAVVWLAVSKVNGVCLWLDPDYPADRLAFMIADAVPTVLVIAPDADGATRELAEGLRTVTVEPAFADAGPLAPDTARSLPPRRTAPAQSAAYVIYTSGTTGRPKGTILTSTGLRSLLATAVQGFGAGRDSRVLQFTSMSFDVAFLEMSMALLLGGTLVVVPAERRVAEPAFLELLREQRVTHAALPPAFLELLPEEGPLPDGLTIMTGADKVPLSLAGRWARRARVVACYGLTEATVNSTLWDYDASWDGAVAPLGTEDPGTVAHLLDDSLRPVPAGQPGELYLGGDGLARGYLHRPALTAERFVADPYGAPGARMYRTGDRAVRHGSGVLEFLGRVDGQLKIRGHRIEPTDVESVLLRHPSVAQAVVTSHDDTTGGAELAAYVVPAEGAEIDARELRRHVARTLPPYMVPSLLVPVSGLATLPSGKLDRRAVLRTAAAHLPAEAGEAGEEALRQLLSAVLGCDEEEFDDGFDFVALGGHSLTAMRLATECRRLFGREPSMRDVFAARRAGDLLACLTSSGPDRPRPGRRGGEPVLLSHEQERLWLLEALSGGGTHYHVPWAWQVHGDLDPEALRGALEDLAACHDILRTRFPAVDGTPRQEILPPQGYTPDYAVLPVDGQDLSAALEEAARESFDLATRPPWRVRVLTAPDTPPTVLVCLHHMVVDDWSVDRLATQLEQAYAARLDPGLAPPARPALQFADFSTWQRRVHDTPTEGPESGGVGFWREFLRGVPVESGVPLDRVRPDVPVVRGERLVRRWSDERHSGVRELARAAGSSVYMVVHAALAAVLAESGAGPDVVVGCPVSTRRGEGLEDVVGFFVNTVALRCDVGGDVSFGELLVRVRDADLSAFDRGDVPFNRVVEAVNPPRHPSRNPLFQVLLAQQHHVGRAPGLGDAPGTPLSVSTGKAIFDMAVDFQELPGGGMELTVEFGAEVLDRSTVGAVVDGMERLLDGAVAGEERVIRAVQRVPSVTEGASEAEPGVVTGEETVAVLRRLFSEVLDQPDVRDEDSFFDLGGHSLTAMRLINAIERELGVRPRVVALFGHPTPAGLARHLPADPSAPPELGGSAPGRGPVPLSYEQERLWILEAMSGVGTLYHVPWAWRTRGPLDTAALRGAMEDLATGHAILRTRFPQVDGVPVQDVLPPGRSPLDFAELSTDEEKVADAVAAAARSTFRLEDEPPLRVRVFRLQDDDHVILMCLHHLITDDRSMPRLAAELSRAYAARLRGGPVLSTPAQPQFAEYARWQRRTSRSEPDSADVGFWREFLRGVPVESGVPLDRVRPDVPVVRGERLVRRWSDERHSGVRELARAAGSSVYMVVHAALAAVLAESGAGPDVVVGCPVSTRRGEGLEDVVGFFVNTVALRCDVGGDVSFGELLVRVRDADLSAFDRGDVPFNRVVEAVNPPRHPSRNPLFQVLLAQQHHTRLVPDLDGVAVSTPFPVASGEAAFDLAIAFSELPRGGMELTVEFSPEVLDRSTVGAVVDGMEKLLDGAVAGEERLIRAVQRVPSVTEGASEAEPGMVAGEETVAVLRRLFSEVLDQPDVRDDDSFFDLGGHSLTAMRLIARVKEHFGVRVPVRTLMKKPRLMSLAGEIESRADGDVRYR
ncbi:amino acid adenylation domain-containing protein [Streptomyces sp. NPDC059611]|uniref:amino acid adenylation domain-containing protein n=1 Tax=Streptomyces sp. NPDC059611 TaxID=3346884 RepID=UPI0036961985